MACTHPRLLLTVAGLLVLAALPVAAADSPPADLAALEGLWAGPWGLHVGPGKAVRQPVMAELVIAGDRVELLSFPDAPRLAGALRLDARAGRITIVPAARAGEPPPREVVFGYALRGDRLTLTDAAKRSVDFTRHGRARDVLAGAAVQFVLAAGLTDAGDLVLAEFSRVRAGPGGDAFYTPSERKLRTGEGAIFLVEDAGLTKLSLDEARRRLRSPAPVALAFREPDRPGYSTPYRLWPDARSPAPDSPAVARTLARTLRPGTLLFILPAGEKDPVP